MSKKRLTDNNKELIKCVGYTCEEVCHQHPCACTDCPIEQGIIKLAEYEDLEEQNLLLRLPCDVGEVFWELNENTKPPCVYPRVAHSLQHCVYALERLGKTVFLTQTEAEEKLRELG